MEDKLPIEVTILLKEPENRNQVNYSYGKGSKEIPEERARAVYKLVLNYR